MLTRSQSVLPVLLLLATWELLSRSGAADPVLFPPFSKAILALVDMARSGDLARDIISSYSRMAAGLVLGSVVAIGLGVLTGRIRRIGAFVSPIVHVLRPLPPVAIIPLIIVWLGIGESAKIFSIAFAVFFPVWLNTHAGAAQVPRKLLWSASTLSRSRSRLLFQIILPAALPFIAAGLRLGISLAFVMVFVSELAGASQGIGYQIATSHLAYRIDRMIAALMVLGVAGAGTDLLFTFVLYRSCPWLRLLEAK